MEDKAIGVYQLNLNNRYIETAISRIIQYIKIQELQGQSDQTKLLIDYQASLLVDALLNPNLQGDFDVIEDPCTSAIARVLDWIDFKIEQGEDIALEEILKEANIENCFHFFKAFEKKTHKQIHRYCRERKIDLINQIFFPKFSKSLSRSRLRKLFRAIHEQVYKIERGNHEIVDIETILSQVAEEIGCQVGTLKNACSLMRFQPYHYYQKQCLEWAKYLLLTTDYSIVKIADKTGYSVKGLNKAMKKNCGFSPHSFRKHFGIP